MLNYAFGHSAGLPGTNGVQSHFKCYLETVAGLGEAVNHVATPGMPVVACSMAEGCGMLS